MKPNCMRLRTPKGFRRLLLKTAGERGAELFEFAMVAPVLLMLVLGIIWMGRAYNIYQTITRAAREGARYAVLPSCATCGNTYVDTYNSLNACLSGTTNIFTNYVSPSLLASNLDPTAIPSSGTGAYCQKAVVLDTGTAGVNSGSQQCGVQISFAYPVQLSIPFTSVNATTINIPTSVQMRMENQPIDGGGNPTCP